MDTDDDVVEGAIVLHHVLPYRIAHMTRGDYDFEVTDDEGEIAETDLDTFMARIEALMRETIATWGVAEIVSSWNARKYQLPILEKFTFHKHRGALFRAAGAPWGHRYIKFDGYRQERRYENGGGRPDIPYTAEQGGRLLAAQMEAHAQAIATLEERTTAQEAAEKEATLARKRAELEKLKAELGDGA